MNNKKLAKKLVNIAEILITVSTRGNKTATTKDDYIVFDKWKKSLSKKMKKH